MEWNPSSVLTGCVALPSLRLLVCEQSATLSYLPRCLSWGFSELVRVICLTQRLRGEGSWRVCWEYYPMHGNGVNKVKQTKMDGLFLSGAWADRFVRRSKRFRLCLRLWCAKSEPGELVKNWMSLQRFWFSELGVKPWNSVFKIFDVGNQPIFRNPGFGRGGLSVEGVFKVGAVFWELTGSLARYGH